MLKAPVFQPVFSPPSPACLTTNELTLCEEPRSTVICLVPAVVEHHLLAADRIPSTALAGVSVALQAATLEVTGRLRARLVPSDGAAGGGVQPSWNDGGTSPAPVPQLDGDAPMV